jgi:FkbH-like protein
MVTFNKLKKNLRDKMNSDLKPIRMAMLSDNASQLTVLALKGYGVEVGLSYNIYESEYNQIDQEIMNDNSGLYQFKPEFILLNLSAEHLIKKFYIINRDERYVFAENQLSHIQALSSAILSVSDSKIIINNFIEINDSVFGNYAVKEKASFLYQLRKLNMLLMDYVQGESSVFMLDLLSLQTRLGYDRILDPKMYINADMVYSLEFLPHVAQAVSNIVLSAKGSFKKCIILDLDNTIWGGIIGDDGMEGIQIGTFGIGKAFSEFQYWLKELKKRGVLLAVCSKNTEEIAKEPFEKHPDMILSLEDIAIFVANWENKVDNIRHIQQTLNIGFDSMVFIDDNPFERGMVKSGIPEIVVPDMPEDPSEYLLYLRSLNLFETTSVTQEDEDRTILYQEEAKRTTLQKTFANEKDFLLSLEMKAEVRAVDTFAIPRVAQLIQRSNQFNLRTIRYTESDIEQLSNSPKFFVLSFTLEDKFGKHGMISVVLLKILDAKTLFIDTWIMSCRVLKRTMEQFVLNSIVEIAKKNSFTHIKGEYIPTKKNGIVKDHYRNLEFLQSRDGWELKLDGYHHRKTFITQIV